MQSIKDILSSVVTNLSHPEKSAQNQLWNAWPQVAGPNIAPQTKPVLMKNGRCIVWVEHSALAFELANRYKQSFLKRIQAVVGEDKAKSIYFKVGQIR